jgi:hypothetical protein
MLVGSYGAEFPFDVENPFEISMCHMYRSYDADMCFEAVG